MKSEQVREGGKLEITKPFRKRISLEKGIMEEPDNHWHRYLNDMKATYQDQKAVNRMAKNNPLLYEVYEAETPNESGHLIQVVSIIHPGKIGDEYFMTKGHYHENRGTAEIYLCLSGEGYLLTKTEEGDFENLTMKPGISTYIPPHWAHRTVNVGDEPFVFFGTYHANAGHDYGSIEDIGFPRLLVEENGRPISKPNPRYRSR